jgi:hypothetical protein
MPEGLREGVMGGVRRPGAGANTGAWSGPGSPRHAPAALQQRPCAVSALAAAPCRVMAGRARPSKP